MTTENREPDGMAALDARGSDLPAANWSRSGAGSQAGRLETPRPLCEGEREWDDPPCKIGLASRRGRYLWDIHRAIAAVSMTWTGGFAIGQAWGSRTLERVQGNSFTHPRRATGLLPGSKRTGRRRYSYAAN